MHRSQALELVNYVGTGGSMAGTYQLSTLVPYGADAKPMFNECCVVLNVTSLLGTTPGIQFDVYEIVDSFAVHVGTTGTITGTTGDTRVIASDGNVQSTGSTFSTGSNTGTLRLLGKGSDLRVVGTTTGTVGTVAFTINAILY